jgi:cysteinyl-tRNA synthetase
MDDDLNVAEAWGALFTFVREANAELDPAGQRVHAAEVDEGLEALASMDRVFGVLALADREVGEVSDEFRLWIEERLAERARARESRDFARADAIRDELESSGVGIEDTPAGSRWKLVQRG